MNDFLTTPTKHTRTPRTSRDICRDSVPLDYYPPRNTSLGHRVATLVGLAIIVVLLGALAIGYIS